MSEVIVRMPPSPTGHLHLGTARTGLFNYLFAKHHKGKIIFRWEDTDKERSKAEFETEILEGLKWLGMDFVSESHLLVRQTESLEHHTEVLKKLWDEDKVFPCFTTPEELDLLRSDAEKNKQNFVFWSPFRDWDKSALETEMDSGKPFAWRIRCPKNEVLAFQDLVRGENEVNSDTLGDFVVARSDGSVLYLLANVIDDDAQGITHVIRGEDHISNTPKQLLCWKALEVNPPQYAHIPLVLDQQKRKLSKRRVEPGVAVLIEDFQSQGFLPEAVVNGLAFLGWNPKNTEEVFDLETLISVFDLKGVNPASAQYDFEKMKWFNQQWMKQFGLEDLTQSFIDWAEQYEGSELKSQYLTDREKLKSIVEIVHQKAKVFSDFANEMTCFFDYKAPDFSLLTSEKMKVDLDLAKQVILEVNTLLQNLDEADFNKEKIRELSIEKIGEMGLKNGQFLWPFRVAISGLERSPGPFEIAEILGKEETLERLSTFV